MDNPDTPMLIAEIFVVIFYTIGMGALVYNLVHIIKTYALKSKIEKFVLLQNAIANILLFTVILQKWAFRNRVGLAIYSIWLFIFEAWFMFVDIETLVQLAPLAPWVTPRKILCLQIFLVIYAFAINGAMLLRGAVFMDTDDHWAATVI